MSPVSPIFQIVSTVNRAFVVYLRNFYHLIEKQFNIEIQTIFNSQCAFLLFGKTNNELRLQFNAKQSSTTKLPFLSLTYIDRVPYFHQ